MFHVGTPVVFNVHTTYEGSSVGRLSLLKPKANQFLFVVDMYDVFLEMFSKTSFLSIYNQLKNFLFFLQIVNTFISQNLQPSMNECRPEKLANLEEI